MPPTKDEIKNSQLTRIKQNLKYYREEKKKLLSEYNEIGTTEKNSAGAKRKSTIIKRVRELDELIKKEREYQKSIGG